MARMVGFDLVLKVLTEPYHIGPFEGGYNVRSASPHLRTSKTRSSGFKSLLFEVL